MRVPEDEEGAAAFCVVAEEEAGSAPAVCIRSRRGEEEPSCASVGACAGGEAAIEGWEADRAVALCMTSEFPIGHIQQEENYRRTVDIVSLKPVFVLFAIGCGNGSVVSAAIRFPRAFSDCWPIDCGLIDVMGVAGC